MSGHRSDAKGEPDCEPNELGDYEPMARYILLLHEAASQDAELSPEEMQKVIQEYVAWSKKIQAEGHHLGGEKLGNEGGRWIQRDDEAIRVVDGPYTEAKEVISGFFMIQADDYDQAVEIAQECPHMNHGWIEVRAIDDDHT